MKKAKSSSNNGHRAVGPSSSSNNHTGTQLRFSRTKTGCFTCRARRKKCDEQRDPQTGACERCRNANVECLGFPPLKNAPPSAHRKASQGRAVSASLPERGIPSSSDNPRAVGSQTTTPSEPQLQPSASSRSKNSSDPLLLAPPPVPPDKTFTRDSVGSWADLFAMDGGDQMLYENILFDSMLANDPQTSGMASTSMSIPNDFSSTSVAAATPSINPAPAENTVQPLTIQDSTLQQEDEALTRLATFYGNFCWHRWQPFRWSYSEAQMAIAIKKRLQSSDLLCISAACLSLCYGIGNNAMMLQLDTRPFLDDWPSIFELITTTKSVKLCAFLDWLGETSHCESSNHQHRIDPESIRQAVEGKPDEDALTMTKRQGDMLFLLASQALQQVTCTAHQDQELPLNRATPLDKAALVHVDMFLHAAMDVALFAYASQSAQAFLIQLESATDLVNSLLGRSQSVRLRGLQSIEMTGLRSFVWCDIVNAVLSGRSTILHYLPEEGSSRSHSSILTDRREEEEKEARQDGLSFGCPDEVLVIMASIANLHFQLRHARSAGALPNNGPDALPAWALHSAQEMSMRIEKGQEHAETRQQRSTHGSKRRKRRAEKHSLGTMWRHAALIFLQTTVYRLGPMSPANQQHMRIILKIHRESNLQPIHIAMGNAAMPLLFAAFVAVSPEDREASMIALRQTGTSEKGRDSYRHFVEKLWARCDEQGFGVLWQDMLPGPKEAMAIM